MPTTGVKNQNPNSLKQTERSTDFTIFTRDMEIVKAGAGSSDGKTRIKCIASSSIEDRHGDTITAECIASMKKQATGLTIFRNHAYSIPDDVFGYVEKASVKRLTAAQAKEKGLLPDHIATVGGETYAFLELDVVVDESNEFSKRTLASMENGVTLGVSIGAMILSYDEKEGFEDSWFPPLIINDVELLEASIVGIPANPLSWVEGAAKAVAVSKGVLGKRASREDLDRMLSKARDSGAKDDDKAETVPPANVPEGEDMPDAEEEGADEVGEDTPAAADKEVVPEPNPKANSPAFIVDTYRAMLHPEDDSEDVEPPTMKELRVLVQDELHDLQGIRPSEDEVQLLLDAISENRPLEAVTKADTTGSPEEPDDTGTDAQEATEEGSDPDTAEGTDPDDKGDVVAQLEAGILKLSGETKTLLETALKRLEEEQNLSATLAAENEGLRDQLQTAEDDVRKAVIFVNKVLDLPNVRKSAVRSEAKRFSSNLRATYGDDLITILEKE